MSSINWAEVIFYLISLGVVAGIAKQKIDTLVEATNQLKAELNDVKNDHDDLSKEHQSIKLTIVTVPTKDDLKGLTNEVQQLRLAMTRLEIVLEQIASKNGVPFSGHQS
jgi:hypothetical protein